MPTERQAITHAAFDRWYARRRYGTCVECIAIAAPGHALCTACLKGRADELEVYLGRAPGERLAHFNPELRGWNAKRRTYQAKRRRELKALGLCLSCKRPVVPGQVLCAEHRDKMRVRAKEACRR